MSARITDRYRVGMIVNAASARVAGERTKPPSRYTQDSLIDDMINAHRFATTDVDRRILKDTEGLGTSRTRGPIVTNVIKRGLLISRKKGKSNEITSSENARRIFSAVPKALTDPVMTAKWEHALAMVEKGEATYEQVVGHLRGFVGNLIAAAKKSSTIPLK